MVMDISQFIVKVKETIEQYNLIQSGDLVVVGVSGGPDSLALLHVLKTLRPELSCELHVAHLDHSFRGKQAEEEARWVKELATHWGLPVTIAKKDVPALAREKGLSPQEAGHLARYEFLSGLLKQLGAQKIALGHQADDQAETVLMHLFTGSGLEGLRGIVPVHGPVIRPLLYVTREEIEEYCRAHALEPRRDPSNEKDIYLRNKIRNRLMPWLLENINPNLITTLNKTAQILWAEEEYLEYVTKKKAKEYLAHEGDYEKLSLRRWEEIPLALQRRLIRHAYSFRGAAQGLYFQHVEDIRELAQRGQVGKLLHLPGKIIVEKTYDFLLFYKEGAKKQQKTLGSYPLKIPGRTHIPETNQYIVAAIEREKPQNPGNTVVYLPWPGQPLTYVARARRQGDRFSPKGLLGSKKLKDYFIEKKIPRGERDQILLVASEKEVLWIPGRAVSNKLNSGESERYLVLQILDAKDMTV